MLDTHYQTSAYGTQREFLFTIDYESAEWRERGRRVLATAAAAAAAAVGDQMGWAMLYVRMFTNDTWAFGCAWRVFLHPIVLE